MFRSREFAVNVTEPLVHFELHIGNLISERTQLFTPFWVEYFTTLSKSWHKCKLSKKSWVYVYLQYFWIIRSWLLFFIQIQSFSVFNFAGNGLKNFPKYRKNAKISICHPYYQSCVCEGPGEVVWRAGWEVDITQDAGFKSFQAAQ